MGYLYAKMLGMLNNYHMFSSNGIKFILYTKVEFHCATVPKGYSREQILRVGKTVLPLVEMFCYGSVVDLELDKDKGRFLLFLFLEIICTSICTPTSDLADYQDQF
ncbi:hypothetical protein RchiOBHm_Chr5g0007241 [Rosa chinensis]|uniref:Uncharacterized protein n=1 Tax=Rosa chinensis TaxID=74649 RepID=A0A2P6Q3Q7_ROSCH|nr:hypothetical protein RchiOBHm_Chr5g0007241 [Rosa chinensis]